MERKKSVQRRPDTHARRVATLTPPPPPLECFSFPASPFCLFCVGRMSSRKGGKGVSGQSDGEEHMMYQSEKKRIEEAAFCFSKALMEGEIEKYVSQFLPLFFPTDSAFLLRSHSRESDPEAPPPLPSPPIIQGHKSATDIWKLPRKRRSQRVAK